MSDNKRIGILGGTFNPIHIGHIHLAQCALDECNLKLVLFMPSGNSYMKNQSDIQSADIRIQMIQLAISSYPQFALSTIETEREGNTYTCDTLKMLKQSNPNEEYFFIIGADCLFSIENWKKPQEIFKYCTIVTALRDGYSIETINAKIVELQERFDAKIILLSKKEEIYSSTMIRMSVREHKSIECMVPDEVAKYICTNHLYYDRME